MNSTTATTSTATKTPHSIVSKTSINSPTSKLAATSSTSASSMVNTLQPKKSSSSPLSKIKFHSISKRRFSGQKLNMNEKFQLINKKHCTSSSSFIGSDDYDCLNYGTAEKSSSSLKKYFMKFASVDRTSSNSDALEEQNLFHLKRPHHYNSQNGNAGGRKSTASEDNDFNVLNF